MKWLRNFILRRLLTEQQRLVLRDMEQPVLWQPDPGITEEDAAQWKSVLASPLLRKIDMAVHNMGLSQMQAAATAPSSETARLVAHAQGMLTGWHQAKSISVMFATKREHAEGSADTGAQSLDHLNP